MRLGWVLMAMLLITVSCKETQPDYTGVVGGGEANPHTEVPNNIKQSLEGMSIINPTGLQFELKVKSMPDGRRYTKKGNVHHIPAKAGVVTVWSIEVRKKSATNINLQSVLLNGAPKLPNLHGMYTSAGLGIVAEYTFGARYQEDKGGKYFETIYVKARDKRYCKNLVKQLAEEGEIAALNGITPTITAETTERDCDNPNHTFNFDQIAEIRLEVDNDNAYVLAADAEQARQQAMNDCARLYGLAAGMNLAKSSGVLDIEKTGGTRDPNTKQMVGQKAEWSYANIMRWSVQAVFLAYSIYTNIQVAKSGLNCSQFGLGAEEANQLTSVLTAGQNAAGGGGNQQGGQGN